MLASLWLLANQESFCGVAYRFGPNAGQWADFVRHLKDSVAQPSTDGPNRPDATDDFVRRQQKKTYIVFCWDFLHYYAN